MGYATALNTSLCRCTALSAFSLLAVNAAPVSADYGSAMFVVGRVSVIEHSGGQRTLEKGTQVHSGDVVRTSAGARVQLHFADGTLISLAPESELGIDAFRYGGVAAGRDTAFFTLYRGRARFLIGAIGKLPRGRFRATTAVAILEAESGAFAATVGDGLQLSVGLGRVNLRNDRGVLDVRAGERAFVSNRITPPYLVGTAVPYRIAP